MRCKIVACNLLILSVFSFVLTAPVPAQEVREACADAIKGGEDVIILSKKRAPGPMWSESGGDLYDRADGSEVSGPSGSKVPDPPPNSPNTEWWKLTKSSSAPSLQFASPSRPYTSFSPSLSVTQGGSGVAWSPEKNHPVASSSTKEITLASPSPDRSFGSQDTYRSRLPSPPGRSGYLRKMASQRVASNSPPKGFTTNVKNFFSKFNSKLKGGFNKFKGKLGKVKFRPRFHWQRTTVDTGA